MARAAFIGAVGTFVLLAAACVLFYTNDSPGPVEEATDIPAQTKIPDGKFYLMKMLRNQVKWKQRQMKEKETEGKEKLGVHILRSYKQVMASKISQLKAINHLHKLKSGAKNQEDGPVTLLQQTPELFQEVSLQQTGNMQFQPPPAYQYRPLQLQAAPQYQVASSAGPPGYPQQPQGYAPPQPMYEAQEPPQQMAEYPGAPQGEEPQPPQMEEQMPPQQMSPPMQQQQQIQMQMQPPPPQQQEEMSPQQQQQQEMPPQQQMASLPPAAAAQQQMQQAAAPPGAQQSTIDPMAPSFVVPPTPAAAFSAPCKVQFTVQALGLHQQDSITISLLSGPPGSSISTPVTSNPGSTVFTWQPPASALTSGSSTQQACFQARDRTGLQRNKCITVTATSGSNCEANGPPPPPAPPAPQQQQQQQQQQEPQQPPPPPQQQQQPQQQAPYQQQQQQQEQQPPYQQQQQQSYQQQPGQPPAPQQQQQGPPGMQQGPPGQPGYPPAPQQQQQPGYPPQYAPYFGQQPGAPPPQPGYPPQQPGYPPPPQPGYPQQPGYPPQYGSPYGQPQMPSPEAPASHTDCVPLFYYMNGDLRDHFYTTNFKELEGGKLHYTFLGVMTGVYATYKSGTIPVYRYYNNFDHDHVYTTNYKKWGKGGSYRTPDGEHGYTYEGVGFYIYKYPRPGLNPVYVFVNPKNGNKIFSMSNSNAGPHSDNFKLQGQIGYAGCTPSQNDGMDLSHPPSGGFGGGPPGRGGGGPPQQGSPIKMPGGGPPDDNVGLMPAPKI